MARLGRRAAGAPASGPMRGAAETSAPKEAGRSDATSAQRNAAFSPKVVDYEHARATAAKRPGAMTRPSAPKECHRAGWRCGCAGRRRTFASEGVGGLRARARRPRSRGATAPGTQPRHPGPPSGGRCGSATGAAATWTKGSGRHCGSRRAGQSAGCCAPPITATQAVYGGRMGPPAVERPTGTQASAYTLLRSFDLLRRLDHYIYSDNCSLCHL